MAFALYAFLSRIRTGSRDAAILRDREIADAIYALRTSWTNSTFLAWIPRFWGSFLYASAIFADVTLRTIAAICAR
jgi:hypothetical protein